VLTATELNRFISRPRDGLMINRKLQAIFTNIDDTLRARAPTWQSHFGTVVGRRPLIEIEEYRREFLRI
jgi:hypothetical protein